MKKRIYQGDEMSLEQFKEFIDKTYRCKYAGKYTLDESTWVDKDTPMMIHCREHGWFERIPWEFVHGFVCPYESNAMRTHPEWQPRAFVEKAKMKFGDRFEYHLEDYVDSKHEIKITCKKHGDFMDTPDHHLLRVDGGCIECAKEAAHDKFVKSDDEFINQSKKIWGDEVFDYSKLDYVNRNEYITLTCKKHNIEFQQIAYKHLLHHVRCPKCFGERDSQQQRMPTDVFIKRAMKIHKERYTYENVDTKNRREDGKVAITCKKHGVFWQDPNDHLYGNGCPKCAGVISHAEEEIKEFILQSLPTSGVKQGDFKTLGRKELDLFIPEKNLAIEYNGLQWHTEEFGRDRHYHLDKLRKCNEKGIQLIQVFEDEWLEHKNIVLSKVAHALRIAKYEQVIHGRKCEIQEISSLVAKPFFDANHIQGFGSGSIILGAIHQGELVGACMFRKDNEDNGWELTRMATKNNYLCHGLCSKMFQYFIKHYSPSYVKSFADRRWTTDAYSNVYTKMGFHLAETLRPDYRYVVGNQRVHKFNMRKDRLHEKYGLPLTMTEKEMCDKLGFKRIWDCGLFKYIWTANDHIMLPKEDKEEVDEDLEKKICEIKQNISPDIIKFIRENGAKFDD